jgi:hypothetical protein
LLVIGILVIVGVAAFVAAARWFEMLHASSPLEAQQQLLAALRTVGTVQGVVVISLGAYSYRLGKRVQGHQRFPPPGFPVVRRTRVLEGPQARARGRLIEFIGMVLMAMGALVAASGWWVANVLGR